MPGVLSDDDLSSLASWLGADGQSNSSRASLVSLTAEEFDVKGTVHKIIQFADGKVENLNVALQFPDHLMRYGPFICEYLKVHTKRVTEDTGLSILYFILGDTSYGECCVDEVAAQHLSANLVVHYGHTCLSPTRTLPVLFIFPKCRPQSSEQVIANVRNAVKEAMAQSDGNRIVLLYDLMLRSYFCENGFRTGEEVVEYENLLQSAAENFAVANMRIANPDNILLPNSTQWDCDESQTTVGALAYKSEGQPLSSTTFLWFTADDEQECWSPAIRNAALKLCTGSGETCAGFFTVSIRGDTPVSTRVVDASRILRKRFATLLKANDAERIGIVPGTLGVSRNLEVIERCKKIILESGKRYYVVLVGKPNPAKLANFPEIDAFVLVACPENALLDGREYLRPILTPAELEAALLGEGDIFSTPYSTDFRDVLKKDGSDTEEIDSSSANAFALTSRGDWSVSATDEGSAASFLKTRQWQGLEFDVGVHDIGSSVEAPSTGILQGQNGIASRYRRETNGTPVEQPP